MFTKTSGSKRFTSGISRFLGQAFSVNIRCIREQFGHFLTENTDNPLIPTMVKRLLPSFQVIIFASKRTRKLELVRRSKSIANGLIVSSKIFKLLAPCNLQAKDPESWNSFDVQKTALRDGLIVYSKIFKLLAPCNLKAKEPESWNSFDVQKTRKKNSSIDSFFHDF
jgi:hypothetical protein